MALPSLQLERGLNYLTNLWVCPQVDDSVQLYRECGCEERVPVTIQVPLHVTHEPTHMTVLSKDEPVSVCVRVLERV